MESYLYAYLVGALSLAPIWIILFFIRKDTRREMLFMSLFLGILSVATSYYWWTVDWWRPFTISMTKVGIEDFILGFFSGGILAVSYEVVFRKRQYRSHKVMSGAPDAIKILLFLAFLTSFLFWGLKLTSFWASTTALLLTAGVMYFYRRDLILNGVFSGLIMSAISVVFYRTILSVNSDWIQHVYQFNTLSGRMFMGIPVEEFVFWFLAGLVRGPFYEYWQNRRLRRS